MDAVRAGPGRTGGRGFLLQKRTWRGCVRRLLVVTHLDIVTIAGTRVTNKLPLASLVDVVPGDTVEGEHSFTLVFERRSLCGVGERSLTFAAPRDEASALISLLDQALTSPPEAVPVQHSWRHDGSTWLPAAPHAAATVPVSLDAHCPPLAAAASEAAAEAAAGPEARPACPSPAPLTGAGAEGAGPFGTPTLKGEPREALSTRPLSELRRLQREIAAANGSVLEEALRAVRQLQSPDTSLNIDAVPPLELADVALRAAKLLQGSEEEAPDDPPPTPSPIPPMLPADSLTPPSRSAPPPPGACGCDLIYEGSAPPPLSPIASPHDSEAAAVATTAPPTERELRCEPCGCGDPALSHLDASAATLRCVSRSAVQEQAEEQPVVESKAPDRGMHLMLVRRFRIEYGAHDLVLPAAAAEWPEAQLRAFFEAGGIASTYDDGAAHGDIALNMLLSSNERASLAEQRRQTLDAALHAVRLGDEHAAAHAQTQAFSPAPTAEVAAPAASAAELAQGSPETPAVMEAVASVRAAAAPLPLTARQVHAQLASQSGDISAPRLSKVKKASSKLRRREAKMAAAPVQAAGADRVEDKENALAAL